MTDIVLPVMLHFSSRYRNLISQKTLIATLIQTLIMIHAPNTLKIIIKQYRDDQEEIEKHQNDTEQKFLPRSLDYRKGEVI